MNTVVVEAAGVAAMGMGLVFFALGIIMLVILGLERAFRPREEPAEAAPEPTPSRTDDAALAAAVAVALALAQAPAHPASAPSPSGAPSPWGRLGRRQQMEARSLQR